MIELLYPFLIIWFFWIPYMLLISSYDKSWSAFLYAVILISSVNIFASYMYLPLGYIVAIVFGLSPLVFVVHRYIISEDRKTGKLTLFKFIKMLFLVITRNINDDKNLEKDKDKKDKKSSSDFCVLISAFDHGRFDINKATCSHSLTDKPIISLQGMYEIFHGFSAVTERFDNHCTVRIFTQDNLNISMFFTRKKDKDLVELNSFLIRVYRPLNKMQYNLINKIIKLYDFHIYNKEKEVFYSKIHELEKSIEDYFNN